MNTKRIISFSLFGNEDAYIDGAFANCKLTNEIYPGWECRIYVSDRVSTLILNQLRAAGAKIVVMKQKAPYDGLLWRFLPAADRDLDTLIVRDIDSRLGARERAAVDEWLASGLPLHIIRDHPNHRRLIPAGLWGCRGNAIPDMADLIDNFKRSLDLDVWDVDADFLDRYVYPKFIGNMFVHSEFQYFHGESPKPIPHQRGEDEYLGFPPNRGEISEQRRRLFRENRHLGLTEKPLPAWIKK